MNIKDKIKLNITFYNNVNLIYIKKVINEFKEQIQEIETINERIKNIIKDLNENKFNLITNIINRSELFGEVKEKIINIFNNQFKDASIDINNGEINNYYFYTFLLKNNLYDEISYKNTEYLNENYM